MPADLALRGVIYSVPDEKVGEMRALGATVPTEEDYAREAAGRGTGSVKAAGESLFRGATLGFGELLLRKVEALSTGQSLAETGEAIQMRKQANPGIDFAGQVAGNVGFTLLTGGTGAIAKAAQVGRLGRVALMAGEGGLWGLGSEVSEATLENRPVIAERAGQAMAAGALLGGGMEAGAQLIGKLGSATLKALGSKSASEGLNNAADAVERRILFKGQPDEFLETQGLQPHMQARMREHGVGVEVTPENVVKMENARASTSGKAIGEDLAQADAVLPLSGAEVPAAPTGPVRSRVAASALGEELPAAAPKDFASEVEDAARRAPNFTGAPADFSAPGARHSAFISDIYETMKADGTFKGSMEDFKQQLLESSRDGKLTLARNDLVEAVKDPKKISASEIDTGYSQQHLVRVGAPKPQQKVWRVQDAEGRGPVGESTALREKMYSPGFEMPPSPQVEFPGYNIADLDAAGKKWGWASRESAEKFWGKDTLQKMEEEGYKLVQVPAESVQMGKSGHQVLFKPISAAEEAAGTPMPPMNEGAQNRLKWAEGLTKHLEEKFGEKASYQSTLKNVLGEVEFNARNEKLNLQKLWDWQAEIFDKLTDADKTTAQFKVFNEAREFTRDWVTENASKAIPELADQIRKNAKDYAADSAVLKLLRKQMGKEQTSGIAGFSWRNAFWGGIAGEMVGGFPGRIVGSVLGGGGGIFTNHFLAQKGGAMAVNAMRALADSSLLTGMSKGLQSRWLMAIRMAPDVIAPFRGPIEAAFAGSHETALATHAHLAQGPNGADYLHALQYKPEGPDEMQQASERMAALHAIEQHSNQAAAAMDAAVGAFFGEKAGRPSSLGISLKDYDKKLAGVQSADPMAALQKLPPELMNAAPTVMAEAVASATKALQYLKSTAPKDPNQGLPKALQRPWKPSQADVERWLRRVEAVESPAKVVESLGKSSVTREHIEALAAVYPQLLGELQLKLATRVQSYQGQLSYEKRVALSHVLGPAALGITPAQVALMQQTFQKASAPAAPTGSRRDGRQKVDQQKNLQTQAQRLEGR